MSAPFQQHTLSNGWTLATTQLPHAASVAIGIFVRVGSRHEGDLESGAAHFIEHLLFKGTHTRSAKDIVWEVEGAGGSINAYTTEDHTCYDASGPAELLPMLTDVLLDIVWNSTLPEDEVARERSVIEEEIIMYRENPSDHVDDLATEALWAPHPLGRPILGNPESLLGLDRSALEHFYRRHYHGGSHIISISGPQPHAEMRDAVEARLASIDRTPGPAVAAPPAFDRSSVQRTIRHECRPIDQSHLSISFHIPGVAAKKRQHYLLLSTLLSGTMSSRLFQRLREQEALCYSIDSDLSLLDDTGSLDISVGADTDLTSRAIDIIGAELRDLAARGPTSAELEQTRRYMLGQSQIAFETTGSWMTWCAHCLLDQQTLKHPADSRASLARVTSDQVRAAAAQAFTAQNLAAGSISGEANSPVDRLDLG